MDNQNILVNRQLPRTVTRLNPCYNGQTKYTLAAYAKAAKGLS